MGHKYVDCKFPRRNINKEPNIIEGIAQDVSDINLSVVISEVNLLGSNLKEWWTWVLLVTFALIKVCYSLFNILKMERKCTCGIIIPLKSREKGKWC